MALLARTARWGAHSAPSPFTAREQAVIRLAQQSFQFFLAYVYPASFKGETFPMAGGEETEFTLSKLHYDWARVIEQHNRVTILAPRAHLKSTVVNHAFLFWRMFSYCRPGSKYDAICMSYNDDLARGHTILLKEAVSRNSYCRFWVDLNPMAKSVIDYAVHFGASDVGWRGEVKPHSIFSNIRGKHPRDLVCFEPGTLIRVAGGRTVPINELKPDDLVVTHTGKRQRVLEVQTRPYTGELLEIEHGTMHDGRWGTKTFRCTVNHPILTKRGWVPAGELTEDDVLLTGPYTSDRRWGRLKRPFVVKNCAECGYEFRTNSGSVHCSRSCQVASNNHLADRRGARNGRFKGGPITINCAREGCAGSRLVTPAKVAGARYCSVRCRGIALDLSGKNNPRWRGGPARPGVNDEYGPEFNLALREQIRNLYGRQCAVCSAQEQSNKRLDVHHIDHNKQNNAADNLVALCHPCHMKTNVSDKLDGKIKSLVKNGRRVRSVKRVPYTGLVYNLEVEEDHTYQLEGAVIAHNCDDILSDFANPLEPTQIHRIHQIYTASLESVPTQKLILIGTPQSYEDTLYKNRRNPEYFWARFPAEYTDNHGQKRTQWPERFDRNELRRVRNRVGLSAYQVEYLLVPFLAVDSFLPREIVEEAVDHALKRFDLDEPFPDGFMVYGGMDVGKRVHPTHVALFVKLDDGTLIQVYEKFLDGMNYRMQARFIARLMKHFGVARFYYDATRAELDDRIMSKRVIGKRFTKRLKADIALGLEWRFAPSDLLDDDEEPPPGISLLPGDRQVNQIVAVNRELQSLETEEGHGDAFWSNALAVRAALDGPVVRIQGDAQEVFGGHRRIIPHSLLRG